MVKIIDSVLNFLTPAVVKSFPEIWFKQALGPKESMGLDSQRLFLGVEVEEMLSLMDEAGVEKSLVHAMDLAHWGIRVPAELVAQCVNEHPDRLIAGAVGVDPYKGMESVRMLEKYVRDYGFRSLHFFPHWIGRPPNDAIYYPFYAKCIELDIAVCIQIRMASQNFLRNVARPESIDEVASYFPELRIVGLHGGAPWLQEYMALMLKHPNLYVTTSTFAPRDWDDQFVKFVNGKGRDKVIFGSASPMVRGGIKGFLAGIQDLDLAEETQRKFFRENAERVFKLAA